MAVIINGSGSITGLSVGGLPNGIVDADTLASNAVTSSKLATGVGGKLLQYKTAKRISAVETSSGSYSEVTSDLRITLTPTASDTTIHIIAYIYCSNNNNATTFRIRRNTASDFSGTSTEVIQPSDFAANEDGVCTVYTANAHMLTFPVSAYEISGNTTARTYSPFYRIGGGTTYINRLTGNDYQGVSTMVVMEIAA